MKRVFLLSLQLAIAALVANASRAEAADDQVQALIERYNQVEAQIERSVHYVRKEVSEGDTKIEQAWFNGASDLLKVAIEHRNASGREWTEYFTRAFDNANEEMFVLTRNETPLPDGGTQVDEIRKYFGESKGSKGELIRELRKTARFKPGQSLDTVHAPNAVVDLARQPKDDRSVEERTKAAWEFFSKPEKIAAELQKAGPPAFDPFANVKGDSEKFRVIHGTASPDGRYAIALGFAGKEIDWEDYQDQHSVGTYSAEAASGETPPVINYVVDLGARRILGRTGCEHFGTRTRYNHRECSVVWSADCLTFTQTTEEKWNYVACRAGRIAAGPRLVGTVDLGKEAERSANAFLVAHKRSHDRNKGSIALGVSEASNDGVIQLQLWSQASSGPNKGDVFFTLLERIRLRANSAGLRLETLDVRYAPKE